MTRQPAPSRHQERALIETVIYATLFDYPLTVDQLRESLIGEPSDEETLIRWYESSRTVQATIEYDGQYFFARGRRDLIDLRRTREAQSRDLLNELDAPLRLVTMMPFVRMVAVSGSLAHLNAGGQADLDLFVVTSPGRVWSVTVTLLAIARLFRWRDRLCLNYVVSERQLQVGPPDLFTANQIIHLRPLTGHNVYLRFLNANAFVRSIYPNFEPRRAHPESRRRVRALVERVLSATIAPIYEQFCRAIYRRHLHKRSPTWQSRDQVRLEEECLKLHTSSHRADVMSRFDEALSRADARLSELKLGPSDASNRAIAGAGFSLPSRRKSATASDAQQHPASTFCGSEL